MHARLRGSKSLLTLYQIINKTRFPSLADEIPEPHPDMNFNVATFTVSEKSSNVKVIVLDNILSIIVQCYILKLEVSCDK